VITKPNCLPYKLTLILFVSLIAGCKSSPVVVSQKYPLPSQDLLTPPRSLNALKSMELILNGSPDSPQPAKPTQNN